MSKYLIIGIFILFNLASCSSQEKKPLYQETYSIGKIAGKEAFFKMNEREHKMPDSIY